FVLVLRDAEVDDLEEVRAARFLVHDEQVLGLEIAVDDALLVRGAEALEELEHELGHGARGERPAREAIGEGLPVEELAHHVARAVGEDADVVNLEDVIVADATGRAHLALEARRAVLRGDRVRQEHLDRDAALDEHVIALEYGSHSSFAEEALHTVFTVDELTGLQHFEGCSLAPRGPG